jgi:predicted PurR-regulated permease PerM
MSGGNQRRGALTAHGRAHLLVLASSVLALIVLALFLAIGLDPAVQRLMSWGLPRSMSSS